jgi:hypothetical protein
MAKNVNMTRERKIALPAILAAARDHYQGYVERGTTSHPCARKLEQALEAFRDCK